MATQIQFRRGAAATWTSSNPTLAIGELGLETDTGKFKVGNGTSTWTALSYASGIQGAQGIQGTGYNGVTSTTSNTIGTGSKTFSSIANTGAYVIGDYVRVVNTGTPANYMIGTITALTANSSITVNVLFTGGSGTLAAWTFSLEGLQGLQGTQGTQGTQGNQGTQGIQGAGYNGVTSSSTITIGTGSKVFASIANTGAFIIGDYVRVVNTGTPANYMIGTITALTANTSITVNVLFTGGSGSFSAWTITLEGLQGLQGTQGTQGNQGTQGTQGTISAVPLVFNTGTTSTSSTSGQFNFNNATVSSVTSVYIFDPSAASLGIGDQFWLNIGSTYAQFQVSGTVTVASSIYTIPVTYQASTGAFSGGVTYSFFQSNIGAQGTQGTQGIQGNQGTQGLQGTQGIQGTMAADPVVTAFIYGIL